MAEEHSSPVSYVYLFRAGEFYKIGKSRNPKSRLANLDRFPVTLELVHQIATDRPSWLEKHMHFRFWHARIRGEWFRLTEQEVTEIVCIERCDHPPALCPPTYYLKARSKASMSKRQSEQPSTYNPTKRLGEYDPVSLRRLPKLCHHRGTERAYVTDPATGREVYFGMWGLAGTENAYRTWIADYLDRLPFKQSAINPKAIKEREQELLLTTEQAARRLLHVQNNNIQNTKELQYLVYALEALDAIRKGDGG